MGENNVNYINNNGKRVLDNDSIVEMQKKYLGQLYPFEYKPEDMNLLGKMLLKRIKKLKEPLIVVSSNNCYKSVFALLLLMVNKVEKDKHIYYHVTDLVKVTQDHLDGEYYDSSEAYDNYDVLFVKMNYAEYVHMYNAYCVRNLAQSRLEKGKYTFFFFWGNASELLSNKWMLDENGDGQRGIIITSDDKVKDIRSFIPLTKYINYIDLNKEVNGDELKIVEPEGGKE